MTEKKMSASMVAGAKAAEESLARGESKEVEDKLPEGHPLRKALADGDLDGLPPGHPMRVAIEEAAERYHAQKEQEQQLSEETEDAQDKTRQIRKAKKLDKKKAQQDRIAQEVEAREQCQTAAKDVNKAIDDSLGSMRELYKALGDSEEIFERNPYCKVRAAKLKRLLQAVERGLFDCRMRV
jgi:prophage DNA circulation protein